MGNAKGKFRLFYKTICRPDSNHPHPDPNPRRIGVFYIWTCAGIPATDLEPGLAGEYRDGRVATRLCAQDKTDRSHNVWYDDVPAPLSSPIGVAPNEHHADKGAGVRNHCEQADMECVFDSSLADDRGLPETDGIRAYLHAEEDGAE